MNVNELIDLEAVKLMYNVTNKKAPSPVSDIFNSSDTVHNYQTRHRFDPQFDQKRNYVCITKSFLCRSPSLWLNIDPNLKNCPNIKSFTNNWKKSLFS